MLQNRQTLVDILFTDDDDNYYVSCYDEPDAAADTPTSDNNPWLSNLTTELEWPEDDGSLSSVWSTSSTNTDSSSSHNFYHHHQVTSLSQLPESFLEDASCPTHRHSKQSPRNQRHAAMYKQKASPSPPSSSSPKLLCDSSKTKHDFDNLMNLIKQCPTTAQNFSHLIENSWQILLNAIQDPNTGKDAIEFVQSVCYRNLMTPETLLDLFQHGLYISLSNAIHTLTDGTVLVCNILITIISSEPAIIPYLVEVMTSSKLSKEMNERIIDGGDQDAQAVINFYYQLTEMILSHRENPLQPHIPRVLKKTGVSQHTLNSFEPNSTMQKYLTPHLIKSLVTRCLNRTYSKYATNLNLTLELLANVIKLAYSSENEEWIMATLCCLRDLTIVDKMNSIIKALRRLANAAESSEHCSQGVSLDHANSSVRVCSDFLQFYEQYYNHLMQLMSCETTPSTGVSDQSQCSSTDGWVFQ